VVRAVPTELRGKLEGPEIYHEVLEHRWYLSEQRGHEVDIDVAARSYVDDILRHKPDEKAVLELDPATPAEPL
jgi:hypothetical protein